MKSMRNMKSRSLKKFKQNEFSKTKMDKSHNTCDCYGCFCLCLLLLFCLLRLSIAFIVIRTCSKVHKTLAPQPGWQARCRNRVGSRGAVVHKNKKLKPFWLKPFLYNDHCIVLGPMWLWGWSAWPPLCGWWIKFAPLCTFSCAFSV